VEVLAATDRHVDIMQLIMRVVIKYCLDQTVSTVSIPNNILGTTIRLKISLAIVISIVVNMVCQDTLRLMIPSLLLLRCILIMVFMMRLQAVVLDTSHLEAEHIVLILRVLIQVKQATISH
jgi:predicted transglutaminase-like protease